MADSRGRNADVPRKQVQGVIRFHRIFVGVLPEQNSILCFVTLISPKPSVCDFVNAPSNGILTLACIWFITSMEITMGQHIIEGQVAGDAKFSKYSVHHQKKVIFS